MNLSVAIAPATGPAYLEAAAAVEAWRGRCVSHFAKLEQNIARFLAAHDVETQAVGCGLGCRLGQLATFLEKQSANSRSLRKAMKALDPLKARRDAIVHGDGDIYVGRSGQWLWDASFLKARETEPTPDVFRQDEAALFEKRLRERVQSVCQLLSNFAAASKPQPTAPLFCL